MEIVVGVSKVHSEVSFTLLGVKVTPETSRNEAVLMGAWQSEGAAFRREA